MEQCRVGDWHLALARGYTKRANSACILPLGNGAGDRAAQIQSVEEICNLYRVRSVVPTFRITPLAAEFRIDDYLNSQNFIGFDKTFVQFLDLSQARLSADPSVVVVDKADFAWRTNLAREQGLDDESSAAQGLIFDRIGGVTLYASLIDQGTPVAWGMAVVQDGLVGIFNVITNPSQRGRGFAGRLTQTLLASGYQNGATGAYLQVGTDNKAALVVYARLGFVERYSYHYRRPA